MSGVTKEEFEQGYAERSGMTVEQLHKLGEHAEPCHCRGEGCQGWQMISDHNKKLLAYIEHQRRNQP